MDASPAAGILKLSNIFLILGSWKNVCFFWVVLVEHMSSWTSHFTKNLSIIPSNSPNIMQMKIESLPNDYWFFWHDIYFKVHIEFDIVYAILSGSCSILIGAKEGFAPLVGSWLGACQNGHGKKLPDNSNQRMWARSPYVMIKMPGASILKIYGHSDVWDA